MLFSRLDTGNDQSSFLLKVFKQSLPSSAISFFIAGFYAFSAIQLSCDVTTTTTGVQSPVPATSSMQFKLDDTKSYEYNGFIMVNANGIFYFKASVDVTFSSVQIKQIDNALGKIDSISLKKEASVPGSPKVSLSCKDYDTPADKPAPATVGTSVTPGTVPSGLTGKTGSGSGSGTGSGSGSGSTQTGSASATSTTKANATSPASTLGLASAILLNTFFIQ